MGKASRLFNGNTDQTLIGRVTPTAEQREFLQEQWNNLAEHLKTVLGKHAYTISTWLQGSYKYGTLIKPVHLNEEYDVDVGFYFGGMTSKTLNRRQNNSANGYKPNWLSTRNHVLF